MSVRKAASAVAADYSLPSLNPRDGQPEKFKHMCISYSVSQTQKKGIPTISPRSSTADGRAHIQPSLLTIPNRTSCRVLENGICAGEGAYLVGEERAGTAVFEIPLRP